MAPLRDFSLASTNNAKIVIYCRPTGVTHFGPSNRIRFLTAQRSSTSNSSLRLGFGASGILPAELFPMK
jgi:hypothetical protein